MTVQTHDPSALADGAPGTGPAVVGRTASAATRPRWLLPALAAGFIVGALVVAGVLTISTALYAGLFGGMIVMHLGGHGGHGGQNGEATPDADDLRTPSSGAQVQRSTSHIELDDRTLTDEDRIKTDDDNKHSSHGCH